MKDYILMFRMDLTTQGALPTQEELDVYMVGWMRWLDSIAAKGQLSDGGSHFSKEGRVLRGKTVERTLYASNKESVAGYIMVTAESFDQAVEIAERCPILDGEGTSVEVRETASPGVA